MLEVVVKVSAGLFWYMSNAGNIASTYMTPAIRKMYSLIPPVAILHHDAKTSAFSSNAEIVERAPPMTII